MVWGGGHAGYAGNELYAFDLNSPTWLRLTEPSTNIAPDVCYYPDGKPISRHTYTAIQYSATQDAFISVAANSPYGNGSYGCRAADAFLLGSSTWTRLTQAPSSNVVSYATTAEDPSTGLTYSIGDQFDMAVFNPSTNSWSAPIGQPGVGLSVTAAIDPNRRIMVTAGAFPGEGHAGRGPGTGVKGWNLNNIQAGFANQKTKGDKTIFYLSAFLVG